MLVLSRKVGEKVVIGDSITVTVVEVDGRRVKLAFEAPGEVHILRSELAEFHDRPASPQPTPRAMTDVKPSLVINR